MMRVLHCLDSIDPALGGPVEAVRQFALAARGGWADLEVLTLDRDVSSWQASWPIPIRAIPGARTSYRYTPALRNWVQEHVHRFDAVVIHGLWKYHAVGVARALRGSGVPYFVVPHGMLNPWLRRQYPLKHWKKAILWHWSLKRALIQSAGIHFLCEEERELAPQTFDLTGMESRVIPLGIMPPEPDPKHCAGLFLERFPALRGRRILLYLGRIARVKACDRLLEAFAQVAAQDNHVLVMAGPDQESWRSELEQLAAKLGIAERVVWVGPLYGESKLGALSSAELLLLPSHFECFPVSVLEALACNVPVLITESVNIWREIKRAGAGIVASNNLAGVASGLRHWLSLSGEEQSLFRKRATACFKAHFDGHSALSRHLAEYARPGCSPAGDIEFSIQP